MHPSRTKSNDRPYSFPGSSRITKKKTFLRLKNTGSVYRTKNLIFNYRYADHESRLGFIVTRKVGNAVFRNRVKRWLREVFRTARHILDPAVDIVIIPRNSRLDYHVIRKDFLRFAQYYNDQNNDLHR